MKILVLADLGNELWSFERHGDQSAGFTSTSYIGNGTQQHIIDALLAALVEARGQLGGALHVLDAVAKLPRARINNDVPVS